MSYSRTSYTGPVKNRGKDDQGRTLVSREELADFRRKYGADKTLRDLLNVDRSGKLPEVSSERDMRARGVQGANISPAKDEGAPASRPRASLSDVPGLIARGMAEGADRVPAGRGLGAAFTGAGAAYRGLKAAEAVSAAREAARRAAGAEERIEPMLERLPELGKGMWRSARERAAEPGFKRGGKVETYAKGGSVKGSGCEQRGLRKCKVY